MLNSYRYDPYFEVLYVMRGGNVLNSIRIPRTAIDGIIKELTKGKELEMK